MAQCRPAPDGLLVEGMPFYVGLVRNPLAQPVKVAKIDVCFFSEAGVLLGQMTVRRSFPSAITVDDVVPANSYSPFSTPLLFDGGDLHSVADVVSTRAKVTYDVVSYAPVNSKVTVSTKGSTAQVQIARVKAWNPKKRARHATVVAVFLDAGGQVVGVHHKYVKVQGRGMKKVVFRHLGPPTQAQAARIWAYARVR